MKLTDYFFKKGDNTGKQNDEIFNSNYTVSQQSPHLQTVILERSACEHCNNNKKKK